MGKDHILCSKLILFTKVFLSRNLDNGQIILSETVWTKLYKKLDQRKFVEKSLKFYAVVPLARN